MNDKKNVEWLSFNFNFKKTMTGLKSKKKKIIFSREIQSFKSKSKKHKMIFKRIKDKSWIKK